MYPKYWMYTTSAYGVLRTACLQSARVLHRWHGSAAGASKKRSGWAGSVQRALGQ